MTKYVIRDGALVERSEAAPRPDGPHYWPDIAPYVSPLGTGVINGRKQRRDELRAFNVREVDPGEYNPVANNASFARRYGLKFAGDEE